MKYTRNESNEVIEVKGCTTCPHMENQYAAGVAFMVCRAPVAGNPRKKKLTAHWTGAYHASCPLASMADNVPASPEVKK